MTAAERLEEYLTSQINSKQIERSQIEAEIGCLHEIRAALRGFNQQEKEGQL